MLQTGLTTYDFIVLGVYFALMAIIGFWSMFLVKKQEDYFLGSRSFGKFLQMFAAFGAGTNASDPIVTAKTTFTNGLSGIWSGLYWLFVTPFYWIAGVWYRRMRHLTLGDWFTERYQSRSIALAYMVFGVFYYITYLGVGMTAIGKMGGPLIGMDSFLIGGYEIAFDKFFIIITAVTVLIYGVLGGLRAAYWTDLIQGFFIILLSIILIPVGLQTLVNNHNESLKTQNAIVQNDVAENSTSVASEKEAGNLLNASSDSNQSSSTDFSQNSQKELTMIDGFTLLHERIPEQYFDIVTNPKQGEFPLHYILAITLLNLIGIVCQPHFIATGGGSAKTEFNARFGLVAGNILKRLCTIGWALTALVSLAYLAGNLELAEDPDRVWGVATRELLGPLNCGLVGLMLACLLAALMSSASCYMLVISGLVVRNGYATYIHSNASERTYVLLGRLCGAIVIIGATLASLGSMNVFEQLKFAWEIPIVFAAPFWVGLYWRRANKYAAWGTIVLTIFLFFLIPMNVTRFYPELRTDSRFLATNDIVTITRTRQPSLTDIERREAAIELWNLKKEKLLKTDSSLNSLDSDKRNRQIELNLGICPKPFEPGEKVSESFKTGGKAIFWSGGITPFDQEGNELLFDANGTVFAKLVNGKREFVPKPIELFDPDHYQSQNILNGIQTTNRFKSPEKLAQEGVFWQGKGNFELDFLLYREFNLDFAAMGNGTLETFRLPTRLFLPFLFLIGLSLITPQGNKELLDRYYVKMKTPVDPNPEIDKKEMELSYANPNRFDDKRLFKFWGLEFNKPTLVDAAGFILSFLICFGIIALIIWIAYFQP
ncbi:MAG: hypothetical protein Q4C95_02345 [Planctomycetia bacterium]|nr:hypothetical protein [Planctomycetia bacterium]